ncbi:tRNA pseudouridine(38-40) synthase TruA [Tepidiphilus margaritifer]|uniref:tRNA pseudouridine(38-40) synthase TruA n=1 Tax=Tepidiphilus margaritifer TaxID=203471 RepID=UPI000429EA42|nr:tRNA pseudouridine(38-40) synthase TruA [Tepidiphilus margaritifer]
MRWALLIEYAGQDFHGWQTQSAERTVQAVLESAVSALAAHPVRLHCAGRTDTGVHALAQVVHFDTVAERPASAWVRGVNARLPEDVAVRAAWPVSQAFHARYRATSRHYRYVLYNAPVRPAVLTGRVGWEMRPLALEPMREAAALLLGTHDFSAFRAAQCQARSPVKTLHRLEITRRGPFLHFDAHADAFLHHMVRNLVGALVYVGKGRFPPEWVGEVLERRERALAAPTFAAAGLYFCGVEYPPGLGVPERIVRRPEFGLYEEVDVSY